MATEENIQANPLQLQTEVENRRREIRSDGLAMSIGELSSLYDSKELDISPQYQRFFRWTAEQKTKLVESILLGIPLPQIFVNQNDDGVWEVVDGLQRMSTIFEFMGKLRAGNGGTKPPLKLTAGAKYLPALAGITWDDLPQPLRLGFRRARMNMSILKQDSSRDAKYDLFMRLNTGGTSLSPQEARNCVLVMQNEAFYDWLGGLANDRNFRECVAISDRLEREQYHMELAARLLVLHDADTNSLEGDIGTYITDQLVILAGRDEQERFAIAEVFRQTFAILAAPGIGADAFRRYEARTARFKGGFLTSPFEAAACGIAHHLRKGAAADSYPADTVLEKIKRMWTGGPDQDALVDASKGKSAVNRLRETIPYGREVFAT